MNFPEYNSLSAPPAEGPPGEGPPAEGPAAPSAETPAAESPAAEPPAAETPAVPHQYCTAKKDGIYPDPFDNKNFIMCAAGRQFVQICPAGTIFSESCQCCNWP